MNRLCESGSGEASEPGIELLRRTPPTDPMPGLKRRVWASLQAQQMGGRRRLRISGLLAVAMGLAIVAAASSAGAVIAGRWIIPALERPSATPAVRAPGARAEHTRTARRIAGPAPMVVVAEDGAAAAGETLDVAPADAAAATVRHAAVAPARAATRAPVTPRPVPAAQVAAQERTEVLDALVALRRDRDPVRAGALLDRYLTAHRHGALREEALVLATEAADARGDRAAAERLARAYEAQYPDGRFKQFARNHLAARGPSARNLDGAVDGSLVGAAPAQNKE